MSAEDVSKLLGRKFAAERKITLVRETKDEVVQRLLREDLDSGTAASAGVANTDNVAVGGTVLRTEIMTLFEILKFPMSRREDFVCRYEGRERELLKNLKKLKSIQEISSSGKSNMKKGGAGTTVGAATVTATAVPSVVINPVDSMKMQGMVAVGDVSLTQPAARIGFPTNKLLPPTIKEESRRKVSESKDVELGVGVPAAETGRAPSDTGGINSHVALVVGGPLLKPSTSSQNNSHRKVLGLTAVLLAAGAGGVIGWQVLVTNRDDQTSSAASQGSTLDGQPTASPTDGVSLVIALEPTTVPETYPPTQTVAPSVSPAPTLTNPCVVCPNGATAGDNFVPNAEVGDTETCIDLIDAATVYEFGSQMCALIETSATECCPGDKYVPPSAAPSSWLEAFDGLEIPGLPTTSPTSALDVLANALDNFVPPTVSPTPDNPTSSPTIAPTTTEPTTEARPATRLKLHWKDDYRWQGENSDPRYCMECNGGCQEGDELRVQRCDRDSDDQKFVVIGRTFRPMADISLCFTIMGYSSATDSDGQPITEPIEIQQCEEDNEDQQFTGYRTDAEFELSPLDRPDRCIGQAHHPKSDEKIHPKSCIGARGDTTSEWITY